MIKIVSDKNFFRKGKARREVEKIVEILVYMYVEKVKKNRGDYFYLFIYSSPVTRVNDITYIAYYSMNTAGYT